MHADIVSNLVGSIWYSIVGLVLLVGVFALILIRVMRMDRNEVDMLSRLPLDQEPATVNGDAADE